VNRTSLSCRANRRTRSSPLGTLCPALSPERVELAALPSGDPLPSITSATPTGALFGGFAGYYEIVGLPTTVHHGITTLAFPARPAQPSPQAGDHGTSRFSRPEIPYMHRFFDPAGSADGSRKRRRRCCLPRCRTASAPQARRFRGSIARPARTPTDASPPPSRTTAHGSGPPWLATPSVLDSLIPFSGPVYPGAPHTNPRTHPNGRFSRVPS
jgi:hypothetical protein